MRGKAMAQQIISLPDEEQVVERDPQELTNKVVAELIDIVQQAGNQEKATESKAIGSKAACLAYRVPFAGVRYYSYE
jgi:hypothetical protein